MYLSLLSVNPPWSTNAYRVHQRLCLGFPNSEQLDVDPFFLQPYQPKSFSQSNVKRSNETGFLYRVDHGIEQTTILVQSAIQPNWDYCFRNAGHLLTGTPMVREFNPHFSNGQQLKFRLVAHPAKRLNGKDPDVDPTKLNEKGVGRRIPISNDRLDNWLNRKSEMCGFKLVSTNVATGYIRVNRKEDNIPLRVARYDGVLEVLDNNQFDITIISGIGPGKSWGCGLLSVRQ